MTDSYGSHLSLRLKKKKEKRKKEVLQNQKQEDLSELSPENE